MKNVLLISSDKIPHYRVPVYNYLSQYFKKYQFILTVGSEGVQEDCPHTIRFLYEETDLSFKNLKKLFLCKKPDVAIFWLGPHLYMLPVLVLAKLLDIKVIHWGHRRPMPPFAFIKYLVYNLEHWVDDAVILYAEQLRKYVCGCFHKKTYIANNTLDFTVNKTSPLSRDEIKAQYGIFTNKNIICMGRMHRRKRINDLVKAFQMLNYDDVGLILVGPDSGGILKSIEGRNIFKLGSIYGEESLRLLSFSDVYCLPGAIGLSVVDAFYCGLPVVTENVIHGPEIMYLKDGINGFMVPKGDIKKLAEKLNLLLMDDALRMKLSQAARTEIFTNGHIDRMCEGFINALQHVCK